MKASGLFSIQYESLLLLGLVIMVVFLLIIVTFSWSHQKRRGKEENRQFAVHTDYQKKLHEDRIHHEERKRFGFARVLQHQVNEMSIYISNIQQLSDSVHDAALSSKLIVLNEKLGVTRRQIAEICKQITPALLLESGLAKALQTLVKQYNSHASADLYFAEKGYKKQDDLHEIMLFRITEEIIANALKHGKPNRIDIQLRSNDEQIVLEIWDNGLPFDLKKKLTEMNLSSSGNGLKDIKSRLQNHAELSYEHSNGMNKTTLYCNLLGEIHQIKPPHRFNSLL